MGRNLVLCFDGTQNEYAAVNTNVVKLYAMLDRTKDDQLTYYQPGIGTMLPPGLWQKVRKKIVTWIDLAVAILLDDHVEDGYRFLMRYYRDGDNIFIFGFSRGAYTARVLAGMLHKTGLLSAGNEELIPFAWKMYRTKADFKLAGGFKKTFSRPVQVQFLGLWDTVSSIGWAWNPKSLEYTANNPSVQVIRHAVALDERRCSFVQNLWGNKFAGQQDIKQVWFPGVHCDVGGGYPELESGLSKIALKWMIAEAKSFGVRFLANEEARFLPASDTPPYATANPAAQIHESLYGIWWIVEYVPRPFRDPNHGFAVRLIIPGGRHRTVADGSYIHASVFERKRRVDDYRPPNVPAQFSQVT